MADSPSYAGAPRWVKAFGIVATVLVVLFVVLRLTGHGPGQHGHHGPHESGDVPPPDGGSR